MDSLTQVFKIENSNIYTYPSSNSDHSGSSSTSDGGYKLASSNPKKRAGRKKFQETRHPVYRGIRRRNGDKWVCELRNNRSRLWLGTYPTAQMAARAHDVAALALRGKSACLNFADSVWRLPVPVSTSDSDVRKAAVEAAEAFRPQDGGDMESEELGRDCSDAESSSPSSSSRSRGVADKRVKESVEELSNDQSGIYMDEEAVFFMPQLLVDLAYGLLLPPPTFSNDESRNLSSSYDDTTLWNYR